MPGINQSYSPPHFVSDGDFAFFVEGYTLDDPNQWTLKVALIGSKGRLDMHSVLNFDEAVEFWPGFAEAYAQMFTDAPNRGIAGITWLIGNTLRACQGIRAVGVWM